MHMPVRDEKIEVAKAYLTVGDPGDKYLSTTPAVDEFGQWVSSKEKSIQKQN